MPKKVKKTIHPKEKADQKEEPTNVAIAKEAEAGVAPKSRETRLYHFAVGRRKTSSAVIKLFPQGKGEFIVNEKPLEQYFAEPFLSDLILVPFATIGREKEFDIKAQVSGGGKHSQAEAVRHGIARALVGFDHELRTTLKKSGFLTRDSRAKERKKYGLKRARKAPQFSKR